MRETRDHILIPTEICIGFLSVLSFMSLIFLLIYIGSKNIVIDQTYRKYNCNIDKIYNYCKVIKNNFYPIINIIGNVSISNEILDFDIINKYSSEGICKEDFITFSSQDYLICYDIQHEIYSDLMLSDDLKFFTNGITTFTIVSIICGLCIIIGSIILCLFIVYSPENDLKGFENIK